MDYVEIDDIGQKRIRSVLKRRPSSSRGRQTRSQDTAYKMKKRIPGFIAESGAPAWGGAVMTPGTAVATSSYDVGRDMEMQGLGEMGQMGNLFKNPLVRYGLMVGVGLVLWNMLSKKK